MYHGVPRKNHRKTVGEVKAKQMRLKEDNEWIVADEAELTKLTSKIVTFEETELAVQRKIAAVKEDGLRLIAMSKVTDPNKMIAIIEQTCL